MAKALNKQMKKLKARIASFEEIPTHKRKGFKQPGSMNKKKQAGGTSGKKYGR